MNYYAEWVKIYILLWRIVLPDMRISFDLGRIFFDGATDQSRCGEQTEVNRAKRSGVPQAPLLFDI
jgi:hypothetical protein